MHKARIRPATVEDFDDILPLLHQLRPEKELHRGSLMEVFARGIDSNNEEYFCAEVEGRIIGFCSLAIENSLWQEGYMGCINDIVVDESIRRHGIGTDLLKVAIDMFKEKGCQTIKLNSDFEREEAHKFYGSRGFTNRAYMFFKEL